MGNKQLVEYIKNQINAGYDGEQLKGYLVQQGYQQADVDAAFNDLNKPKGLNSTQLMQYIAIGTMILIIGGMVWFTYFTD